MQIKKKVDGELNGLMSKFLINKRIESLKPNLNEKKKILDIGCGIYVLDNFIDSNVDYTGIDFMPDIISYNNQHYPERQFIQLDVEKDDLSSLAGEYDLIIILAAVEHFRKPEVILKRLREKLSNNGEIFLTTPHPIGEIILSLGEKIRLFSKDKDQHNQLLNYNSLTILAKLSGLKIIEYKRFLFGLNQSVRLKLKGE